MPRPQEDALLQRIEQLAEALDDQAPGREREWAEKASAALIAVAEALRRHAAVAESPQGLYAEVDLTRPTFVRRMNDLRLEHNQFLKQADDVRARLEQAGLAFQRVLTSAAAIAPLPEPSAVAGVPDFGAIRQQGQQLVWGLKQHCRQEANLVLESVTTDIGAGD